VSDGDGMGFSTQVPVVRCVWVPAAMSYRARHLMSLLPEALALIVPTRYQKPPSEADGSLRVSRA
jgi:hypothetical protein